MSVMDGGRASDSGCGRQREEKVLQHVFSHAKTL